MMNRKKYETIFLMAPDSFSEPFQFAILPLEVKEDMIL